MAYRDSASENEPVVAALLADFEARWQELLSFESEVSRWFTLYVTAVIAVIGWLMGADGADVGRVLDRNNGLNAFLVLVLALLNAAYVIALAFNGYRIQQIGQYLYSHVGMRLTEITGEPFNIWEDWRRYLVSQPGSYGPERIRVVYYTALATVPALVSLTIVGIYWAFEGRQHAPGSGHNLFAYFVVGFTLANGYLALLTSRQNDHWDTLIKRRQAGERAACLVRSPHGLAQEYPADVTLPIPSTRPQQQGNEQQSSDPHGGD